MLGKLMRTLFVVVFLGYSFALLSSYFSYIEPYLFPLKMVQGKARYVTENIMIGPYPRDRDFEKLVKVNKVRVVVSLLNPSLPFEGSLIKKEQEILKKLGVKFYNVPLSYLNLNSRENNLQIAKIRDIVNKHAGEKIYIHCYLGRHRVEFVAKKLIGSAR